MSRSNGTTGTTVQAMRRMGTARSALLLIYGLMKVGGAMNSMKPRKILGVALKGLVFNWLSIHCIIHLTGSVHWYVPFISPFLPLTIALLIWLVRLLPLPSSKQLLSSFPLNTTQNPGCSPEEKVFWLSVHCTLIWLVFSSLSLYTFSSSFLLASFLFFFGNHEESWV